MGTKITVRGDSEMTVVLAWSPAPCLSSMPSLKLRLLPTVVDQMGLCMVEAWARLMATPGGHQRKGKYLLRISWSQCMTGIQMTFPLGTLPDPPPPAP